jgi:hypothetical protein
MEIQLLQEIDFAMRTTAVTAQWIVRITGVILVILGVLFWTGNATALVPVHMFSGTILVLGLWVLAFLALQTGANTQLGIVSLIWGLVVIALGMTQVRLLPGPAHWVIQVIHLLVGIAAMGLAQNLTTSILTRHPVIVRA